MPADAVLGTLAHRAGGLVMAEQLGDLEQQMAVGAVARRRPPLRSRARRRLVGLRARDVIAVVDLVERAGSRSVLIGG
jgi:hypothetical protein